MQKSPTTADRPRRPIRRWCVVVILLVLSAVAIIFIPRGESTEAIGNNERAEVATTSESAEPNVVEIDKYPEDKDTADSDTATDQPPAETSLEPVGWFSVATFNINWGNRRPQDTVDVIRRCGADLVLLQEVGPELETYLAKNMADLYADIRFRGDRSKYYAGGFGVLSSSPITAERFIPSRHGIFGYWVLKLTLDDRAIQVANVHLQPIMFDGTEGTLGAFGRLMEMEDVHLREIEQIYKSLSSRHPTLVAGDFNSFSSGAAVKYLTKRKMTDSFASVTNQPDLHPTWRWPLGQTEVKLRIDYLFHTQQLETLSSRIVESDVSDHSPVVSRLCWKEMLVEEQKP